MNIAIIGYGSIGQRHEKNCLALGHSVDVLSRHEGKKLTINKYDLVIICSKTSEHISDVARFKDLSENFLIEKPLAASYAEGRSIKKLLLRKKIRVGYCMIFSPIIAKVKEFIERKTLGDIYFGQIYAGSYLPDWRQGEDYRRRYSAKKSEGGGVALDLIHEINYAQYLFPDEIKSVSTYQAKVSNLEITSSDLAHFDIEQKIRFLTITLNYFARPAERYIKLLGDKGTLFADLVGKSIDIFGSDSRKKYSRKFDFDYNRMYIDEVRSMERYIKEEENQQDILSLAQALRDLAVVESKIYQPSHFVLV